MKVHIYRGGMMMKTYLSGVRGSILGSQKSEPQKSKAERIEFREGLRGRIMISVLLHISEPLENTKRN
jgi:hypothetical protein